MRGESPLQALARAFASKRAGVNIPVLAAQLGLLPDLRYLVDGLKRSLACVRTYGDELGLCLRAVPGRRFEPGALADAIEEVLAWSDRQAWAEDDPRVLPMAVVLESGIEGAHVESGAQDASRGLQETMTSEPARARHGIRHPLAGYCLTVAFHWSNLFYTLEPAAAWQSPADSGAILHDALMTEFSAYVLAAQSTVDADAYMAFTAEWWASGRLPAQHLYPDRRLGSRVASASRAMRRLTLLEHRALFDMLADRTNGSSLPQQVARALDEKWDDDANERLLMAIDRLLDTVRFERRPANKFRAGDGPQGSTSKSTRGPVHKRFKDGYLRIAYQPAVMTLDAMESGALIETFTSTPPTEESLAQEMLDGWTSGAWSEDDREAEFEAGGEAIEAESSASETEKTAAQRRRERVREEARILVDGQEWIPVQEGCGEGELAAVRIDDEVGDDGPAITATTSNRHVAEHLRRHHMAHGLSRDRLTLPDARALLDGLLRLPPEPETREVCAGLAASLALGRSLEEIAGLRIDEGKARPSLAPAYIHYTLASRQWVLPSPPPAWAEMDTTDAEHRQWQQLFLHDLTGFHALLAHLGLDHQGVILKALRKGRLKAARNIVAQLLPRADATPAQCAGFLFHRLLATGNGDLGIARQVTGKDHSHSASVHHYAHYPATPIWSAYRNAWDPTWTPAQPKPVVRNAFDAGVGAKRVPTTEAVRRLLDGLHGLMRSGPSAQRHNAYTAYTQVGLVLGIGMRPVVEPVIRSFVDIGGQRRLVTYLDKARTDYHRRMNAVPPTLENHLLHYAEHLEALRRQPLLRERAPITFVHIDPESGEPARFQPKHFKALVEPFFPLELYAMRRFARTCLRVDHNVPGEDVDAFMGHWLHQLSPHDRLSTYPMRRLHTLAEGAVEAMLASVGFVACAPPP